MGTAQILTQSTGGKMTEEVKVKTEAELKAELDKAYKTGDYKQISKVAIEIAKFEKDKEAKEHEAVLKELEKKTDKVKAVIEKALKPMIESGELDKADGIWFTNDFGEKLTSCRLTKTAPRKSSGGGGGGGKKVDISTDDLLEKYGSQEYKEGVTFKAAWEADTDKNKRYGLRVALLKKAGLV
jgi:hypothetical protein